MDKNLKKIAERIKASRLELNMSYQDLADKTGISRSTLQRYETGYIKNLPIDKFELIANALNISAATLMGLKEETPISKEQQQINTISNYLYENSKVTLGEIKRGKKVDILSENKIIATYDVELVLKAYEVKPIKEKFSLKDIEDLADRFAIPEDLKGITRKQYIKFMGESAMFFDDASISDETKEKILLSFQKVFYDAKERNKRKKEDK